MQVPQVVADPGGAVVEAREVGGGPLAVRVGPVRPPQSAGRRLRDAEQEVACRGRRAPVAPVAGDRVGGQQAFADRRRADVAIGLEVRRLDGRSPRPAALRHRPMAGDERVRLLPHDLQRRALRHARGRRRADNERAGDQKRAAENKFDHNYIPSPNDEIGGSGSHLDLLRHRVVR